MCNNIFRLHFKCCFTFQCFTHGMDFGEGNDRPTFLLCFLCVIFLSGTKAVIQFPKLYKLTKLSYLIISFKLPMLCLFCDNLDMQSFDLLSIYFNCSIFFV